jgi:hypothetical protein
MIDSYAARERSARRLWSGHVQRVLQQLNLHERDTAGEISESLAVFCQQHPQISGCALSLLMARSFCATGDRAAAGLVLSRDREHGAHTEAWLEVLSAEHPFPELYPLFSSRALRPLRLKTVGEQTVWVLDLEKIHLSDADRHEMILMQTLRALAETVSNVWKKTNGQGTLVVKSLFRFADVRPSSRTTSAAQLFSYIQAVVQRRAACNGWSFVPSVLLLDL